MKTQYKHYPIRPQRLSSSFVKKEYAKLLAALKAAESADTPDLWLVIFKNWNDLKSYIGSEGSRIGYGYSQDVNNQKAASEEEYFREQVAPLTDEPEHRLTKAFLASRHRQAVAKKFGEQLIPIYEVDIKTTNPINTSLRVKAGKLSKKYDEMVAKAIVTVKGEKMTLWKTRAFFESPKESVRKEAYLSNRGWFLSHHGELANIYAELVKIRTKMAQNVGHKNYVPYAYEAMCRTDYNQEDVKKFRQNVLKYATPINRRLAADRAKTLSKPKLKPWDGYNPQTSLPLGVVPVSDQMKNTQKLFNELSPRLGAHFKRMRDLNLIELENRPGKKSGAYCTEFSDEGKVLIFCNSTGDADDVETLTHEMGHAFQGWESQHIEAVDLQWGTMDLCEVYSTGMEFLSLPYMSNFFSETDAKKFIKNRFSSSIGMLCYVSVVDEFQHWVYENPEASVDERDAMWVKISDKYLGDVDFSGYEEYRKTRWYGQSHIFVSPFYYIDYALAETCALQLAMLAKTDHKKALDIYLDMCRLGGTKSFLQAVESGGMRSPFDEQLFKEVLGFASRQLEL